VEAEPHTQQAGAPVEGAGAPAQPADAPAQQAADPGHSHGLAPACARLAASSGFQGFIYVVIVANAVTLGLGTYEWSSGIDSLISALDDVWLGIFVVELVIRITAFGRRPQDFFRDGWNVFDFVVIGLAFIPGLRGNITLLRLARLLRVVRLVSVMPDLRILLRAMVRSLRPIASLLVLTLLLMYVYGMVGWILFGDEDPQNWGNIGDSLLSLFQILTLENWPTFLERGQAIAPASWIFFVSYVLIASFLVINILIAIIINSMEEVHAAEREEHIHDLEEEVAADHITVSARLEAIRHSLDQLEAQVAEGEHADAPEAQRTMKRGTKGGRIRF
jgi:voltage-gated sodium channel